MTSTDHELEAADALGQIAFAVMAVLTRVAADHDLSLTQVRVLGILRDRTPQMAQLADHLGLERSTMSGLIGRAESRGLVRRRPSPDDARVALVEMTPAGRALARVAERQVAAGLAGLVGGLGAGQVRTLQSVARRATFGPSPSGGAT